MSKASPVAPPNVDAGKLAPTPPGEAPKEVKASQLPPGVQMHNAGVSPYATKPVKPTERDPKGPPPDWKGSYMKCGHCGDFLGNTDRCPTCAGEQPSNVQMSYVPKMRAQ